MLFSAATILLFLNLAPSISGNILEFTWNIEWASFNVDGFPREVLTINSQHPSPAIHAMKDDILKITVINHLPTDTVSIHWHGILQRGYNDMDGAVGVTQYPIQPNDSFIYQFQVPHAGSYWYHSHTNLQIVDGLRGPLIVHDPNDINTFSDDLILTLADWYHQTASNIFKTIYSVSRIATPYTGLMNEYGQNISGCDTAEIREQCPGCCKLTRIITSTVYSQIPSCSTISLEDFHRLPRLRVLNVGAEASVHFTIDHHQLIPIAFDAVPLPSPPFPASHNLSSRASPSPSIFISPGQRVDVTICNDESAVDTEPVSSAVIPLGQIGWWMRAAMETSFLINTPTVGTTLGVFAYQLEKEYDSGLASSSEGGSSLGTALPKNKPRPTPHPDPPKHVNPITDPKIGQKLRPKSETKTEVTTLEISGTTDPNSEHSSHSTGVQYGSRKEDISFNPLPSPKTGSTNVNSLSFLPAPTKEIPIRLHFGLSREAGYFIGYMNDVSLENMANFNKDTGSPTLLEQYQSALGLHPPAQTPSSSSSSPAISPGSSNGGSQGSSSNSNSHIGLSLHFVEVNDTVRFVFNNQDIFPHPLHFHGHRFFVLSQGLPNEGDFNADLSPISSSNPVDSYRQRDTELVYPNSYLVIQLVDLNPGVWLMHCHVAWHVKLGLATVLVVRANPTSVTKHIPASNSPSPSPSPSSSPSPSTSPSSSPSSSPSPSTSPSSSPSSSASPSTSPSSSASPSTSPSSSASPSPSSSPSTSTSPPPSPSSSPSSSASPSTSPSSSPSSSPSPSTSPPPSPSSSPSSSASPSPSHSSDFSPTSSSAGADSINSNSTQAPSLSPSSPEPTSQQIDANQVLASAEPTLSPSPSPSQKRSKQGHKGRVLRPTRKPTGEPRKPIKKPIKISSRRHLRKPSHQM